ncbi:hypothetical protein EDC14_101383 [Hydrogenispora ethanolica]|uniref:Cache domain-containing protein n=1 Tax=Hydrogenispora ethanolica TaxID=1082276 RepID=A0A4R1RRH3_HYDET|nr:cache domain-containing protein [Hydrogenispora ethanolica]TCL68542.1 hypothetical protein EDC14_101383 [Hydrogenispora ethanolica]
MFNRLEFKIRALIVTVISTSALITSVFLYCALRQNIIGHSVRLAVQYAEQQNRNAQLFLSLMEETAKLLLNDEDIIRALQNPNFNSSIVNKAIDKLNGIQTSSVSLTGMTIYGLNRAYYSSDSIDLAPNHRPTLEQLMQNSAFRCFATSAQQRLWWTHAPEARGRSGQNAILTLALKIVNPAGKRLGYVLLDMRTPSFFQFFADPRKGSGAYIMAGSRELFRAPYHRGLPVEPLRSRPKKNGPAKFFMDRFGRFLYIGFPISYSSDTIVKVLPLAGVRRQLFGFLLLLLLSNLAFIGGSVWVSRIISASITRPLNELLLKMQKTAPL